MRIGTVNQIGAIVVRMIIVALIVIVIVIEAGIAFVFEQWLMCSYISVPVPVQAHLILHLFDLIPSVVYEVSPAGEFTIIDAKLCRILLNNAC